MSEALALRDRGPSGLCRAALFVWAAAGLVAGCAPPAAPLPAVPPGVPAEPDRERVTQLESGLRQGAAPDSIAAAAMRAAGLTPPFERRFVLDAAAGRLVAGLIPGGHPSHRDSLVVALALGPRAGAALLEAARLMAERSAYHAGPARSLMVALPIASGGVGGDATSAVARTLGIPVWDAASVLSVVVVGSGADAQASDIAERGLAFVPIDDHGATALSDLVLRVYDALLRETAEPATESSDAPGTPPQP
jgi:hypothetical protein